MIRVPYGKRDERHGLAGRSQVRRPSARLGKVAPVGLMSRGAGPAGSRPSNEKQASLDSFSDRGEQLVPDLNMLRVATPCLEGSFVEEIVAYRQIHVSRSSPDVPADDYILASWER